MKRIELSQDEYYLVEFTEKDLPAQDRRAERLQQEYGIAAAAGQEDLKDEIDKAIDRFGEDRLMKLRADFDLLNCRFP